MFNHKTLLLIPILTIIFGIVFFLYSYNLKFPTGVDPGVHLSKVQYIVTHQTIETTNPFSSDTNSKLYSNFILDEYPIHIIMAVLYIIGDFKPADIPLLALLTITFLLCIIALNLYILGKKIFSSTIGGLLLSLFTVSSAGFSVMFWDGNYAQILGMAVLPAIIYLLYLLQEKKSGKILILLILLNAILFITHILTFLFSFIFCTVFLIIHFSRKTKLKITILLIYIIIVAIALLVIKLFPNSFFVIRFPIEKSFSINFEEILSNIIDKNFICGYILLLIGFLTLTINKKLIPIILLGTSYILANNGLLGVSFNPYRFRVYMSLAMSIILVWGVLFIIGKINSKYLRFITLGTMFVIILSFNFARELGLKKIYAEAQASSPTILAEGDYQAFNWIRDNTDPNAIFTSVPEWGLYLPAIAQRRDILVGCDDEEKTVFTDYLSGEQRWERSNKYNFDYIYWSASLYDYIDKHDSFRACRENFDNDKFFKKVYSRDKVRIYKVIKNENSL